MFQSRRDAGKKLAEKLESYRGDERVVVAGLARGGIVVAAEIAKILDVPCTVVLVRKIGAPDNPELALGAISESGEGVFNEEVIALLGVSKEYLKKEVERERELLKKRRDLYLKGRAPVELKGKVIILVDDGIATGASMKVAINNCRAQGAEKIVLATPVAPKEVITLLSPELYQVICLFSPRQFSAVGAFYGEFPQVEDEEILSLLHS